MKKLSKIRLNSEDYVSLSDSMMKQVLGGSGSGGSGSGGSGYTCWCNNRNIGDGSSHIDCAGKCVAWCKANPGDC